MSYKPLTGVRVLDLARLIPGDLASRKLADMGADVVKVEGPGVGDYLRVLPPRVGDLGVHHWNLNRNKRSIQLDIHSPQGEEMFAALLQKADVILEVSVPGRYKAAGLDFAQWRKARPELVVCSLSGFGQSGPWASLPSHGMNLDALAGCVVTRSSEGRLQIDYGLSTSLANELGALNAALGIAAAVFFARVSGQGQWIDISCWDAAVEIQRSALVRAAAGVPVDADEMTGSVLYNLYLCGDGEYVVFCAIERKFWERFCAGVDRPDLVARWQGPAGGVDHRIGDLALREELDRIFASADSMLWLSRFLEWQVPGSPLLRSEHLVALEHIRARGLLQTVADAPLPHVADPIRWVESDSRPGDHATPSPALGADEAAVLRDWLGREG
jgi:crotonobetainyl-CoA:carnitine CoA-transferase CaiB-like acyl-CoA transferase